MTRSRRTLLLKLPGAASPEPPAASQPMLMTMGVGS